MVARYRSPTTFEYVEEECFDVSIRGMFIRSIAPAAAGMLLKLECESDGLGNKIRGVARVVWLRRDDDGEGPGGMGVKFVKLEGKSRAAIEEIVRRTSASELPPFVDPDAARPQPASEVLTMVVAPQTMGGSASASDTAANTEPLPSWRPDAPVGRKVWAWTAAGLAAFGVILYSDWFQGPMNRATGAVLVSDEVAAEVAAAKSAPAPTQATTDLAAPAAFTALAAEPHVQPEPSAALPTPAPTPIALLPVPAAPEDKPSAPASVSPNHGAKRSTGKSPSAKATTAKPAVASAVAGRTPGAPRGSSASETTVASNADSAGRSAIEIATTCLGQGDNACVIDALQGKAHSPREYELLIETLRAVGRSADARKQMAVYVARFPAERRAVGYQRQLDAQGEKPAAATAESTPAAP